MSVTSFILHDANGPVLFWLNKDGAGSEPQHNANRSVEIVYSDPMTPAKLATGIGADSAFTATAGDDDVKVTCVEPGSRPESEDVDTGFSFSVDTRGHDDPHPRIIHDRNLALCWAFAPATPMGKTGIWAFNQNNSFVTGPVRILDTGQGPTNVLDWTDEDGNVYAGVLSHDRKLWRCNLSDIREPAPSETDRDAPETFTPTASPVSPGASRPLAVAYVPGEAAYPALRDSDNAFYLWERLQELTDAESTSLTMDGHQSSHFICLESGWMDFGVPNESKRWRELRLTLSRNTRGRAFCMIRGDNGVDRFIESTDLAPKAVKVIRFNLRARRIQFRLLVAIPNGEPFILRSLEVGFIRATAPSYI